ncbi:MAG: APC family permease [Methanobacterium sp.]|nr:APC family permease [Methanobacterium sp.]
MPELQRSLSFFDVMNLVIGAIVGADIYIAAAFGAGFLGPASVLAWVIAGIMAVTIALCFAECSSIIPRVGGPYAYAKEAFGDFIGFLVGWGLIIAEWSAIAVFPLAFVAYIAYFYPNIPSSIQIIIKILFVLFLTLINYMGVRKAGRLNDALTILKIAPLLIFTIAGIIYLIMEPHILISNFTPFAPLGWNGMGSALVLIFWAYVGFELVTIPSDEIINAKKTIPLAIALGMGIITIFYVITNFMVVGTVPWTLLSNSSAPLALAGFTIMGVLGALILSVGALFSISGSDEAGILTSARIPYAMAGDGLLPHALARIHPKYGTPYISLILQSSITLIAAIFGTIDQLIILSVFTILFCYLVTCMAVFPLKKKYGGGIKLPRIIPLLGIIIIIYMITQTQINQIITGVLLILLGIPVYIKYSPQEELKRVRMEIIRGEGIFRRSIRYPEVFLARALRRVWQLLVKIRTYYSTNK